MSIVAAALDRRANVPPAFRIAAGQQLLVAIYLNTLAIVPRAVQSKLQEHLFGWTEELRTHDGPALLTSHVAAALLYATTFDLPASQAAAFTSVILQPGVREQVDLQDWCGTHLAAPTQQRSISVPPPDDLPPCRAILRVDSAVRGSALVASAFGMLHHRAAVETFVQRWCAGPWHGRLDSVEHVSFVLSLDAQPCSGRPCQHRAMLRGHKDAAMYGHAPGKTTAMTTWTRKGSEGLRALETALKGLRPLANGGRRVVLVCPRLGYEAESIYSDYLRYADLEGSAERIEMVRRRKLACGLLGEAGGALQKVGQAARFDRAGIAVVPLTHALRPMQLEVK